jgi:hypothetical protein
VRRVLERLRTALRGPSRTAEGNPTLGDVERDWEALVASLRKDDE